MKYNKFLEDLDLIESDHKKFSIETPLREDAFELSDQEKIDLIKKNVVSNSERERFQKICEQKIERVQGSGYECSRLSFVRSVFFFMMNS